MATTTFESYLPEVLPFAPDCPRDVAVNAIRNSVIEFCTRTRFWQVELTPITLVTDQPNYTLTGPTDTTVVELVQAYREDVLLIPKVTDELARLFRYTDWTGVKGDPAYYTRRLPDEVIFVPYPQEGGDEVKLRAAVAPTRTATGADSLIYTHFVEDIAKGALARLLATPGQAYSDPTGALAARGLFESAVTKARIAVDRSLGRNSGTVEFQRIC